MHHLHKPNYFQVLNHMDDKKKKKKKNKKNKNKKKKKKKKKKIGQQSLSQHKLKDDDHTSIGCS